MDKKEYVKLCYRNPYMFTQKIQKYDMFGLPNYKMVNYTDRNKDYYHKI